jgi:hypothetical protein
MLRAFNALGRAKLKGITKSALTPETAIKRIFNNFSEWSKSNDKFTPPEEAVLTFRFRFFLLRNRLVQKGFD